mmetsp:Transcript_17994/g.30386  ORF Transcript_17994/g.30386 Transcript_17994/m.30386 type:complete len:223 (-) Transcript_17994:12-680(-)
MRLLDNFRCNPKGTPNHSLSLINRIRQLGTNTKIRQLDMSIIRQQHIPTFNIPMANFLLVQIFQPQHNSRTRRPNRLLGHGKTAPSTCRLDQITNRPPVTKFHNDPHLSRLHPFFRRCHKTLKITNDKGTIAFTQNINLAHDLVGFGGIPLLVGDDFYGDNGAGAEVGGAEYLAEGAFAEHFFDGEFGGGVAGCYARVAVGGDHHDCVICLVDLLCIVLVAV